MLRIIGLPFNPLAGRRWLMGVNPTKLRGILAAAILVVLIILVFQKSRDAWHWGASDPGDVTPVLLADRYIPAFTVINPEMVRIQEFPKDLIPPGALRSKTDLRNNSGQMLFVSAISIPEGQPVTRALVTDASQNDTLGWLIRPGKVAGAFDNDKTPGVVGGVRTLNTVGLFCFAALEMKVA